MDVVFDGRGSMPVACGPEPALAGNPTSLPQAGPAPCPKDMGPCVIEVTDEDGRPPLNTPAARKAAWRRPWFKRKPRRPATKEGWGELPHDILVEVVALADLRAAKAMHRVCRAWRAAVCAGVTELCPLSLNSERLTRTFPSVRRLGLSGINCDSYGAVKLGELGFLESLRLSNIWFATPNALQPISRLKNLTDLALDEILGVSPEEGDALLRALPALTRLELRKGSALARLPTLACLPALRGLQKLTVVDARHSHMLTGLSHVSCLSALRHLTLQKVGVTNGTLRALSGLTGLTALHLPDAFRVTNAGLDFLSSLIGLRALDLSTGGAGREEEANDAGIAALGGMLGLTRLSLAGQAGLSSEGLGFLASFTALVHLDLSGVPLWMGGVAFLEPLGALRTLALDRTHLTRGYLASLSGLTGLAHLSLASTLADDSAVPALAPLTSLTYLDVRFCPMSNAGVEPLAAALPGLAVLLFDGCKVSTLGVARLLRAHPNRALRCWKAGKDGLPRWMNRLDCVVLAASAPGTRTLRVLHCGEGSPALTASVALGVVAFFLLYFGSLLAFFLAVFMFPVFLLACVLVAVCLAVAGARVTLRGVRRLLRRVDACFANFLLGLHHPPPEPDTLALV